MLRDLLSHTPLPIHPSPPRPPGPSMWASARTLLGTAGDQLPYLRELARTYGDVAFFRMGPNALYLISDPARIEQLLLRTQDQYVKGRGLTITLGDVLGRGMLTSSGPSWRRHRKLAAPLLTRRQIAGYGDAMVRETERWITEFPIKGRRDIHPNMLHLTLRIVCKTLFDLDVEDDIKRIGHALDDVLDYFMLRMMTLWRLVPLHVDIPAKRTHDAAVDVLNQIVYGLIDDRIANPSEREDMLSRLLAARDDNGEAMPREQVRDEMLTMLLAGHETTALNISYALHMIAAHPPIADALRAEVDAVLGDRSATVADLASLTYTRAIVNESLRLYPPAYVIGRQSKHDVELANYTIPAGCQILASPWVMHRDERWFEQPDDAIPERWLDGLEKRLPRGVFIPFSDGPRVCIGNHFALMEATLVIATIAQHLTLTNARQPLAFSPSVTLRPRDGVWLSFEARTRSSAS